MMSDIEQAFALKAELEKLRPISKEQEAKIMQKFRLDWNYHSNHLEGNSLTFGETKMLIMHGITAQGKPLKDHIEITGHDEAVKWIEEVVKTKRPLTENFIRELHRLLLKQPYEVDAITADGQPTKKLIEIGKYKSTPNHVKTKTGEIFYFAEPFETPSLMAELLAWYDKESNQKDVNPIILASAFHYKFVRIHPFDDGNGRLARILMNFILMRFGFPPAIIKTEDKENYFFALRQADIGLLEDFINYIAKNLLHFLNLMIAGAKGLDIEEPEDLDKKIALLKQKIQKKKLNEKQLVSQHREQVLAIVNDSVVRLCEEIDESYKVFYSIYSECGDPSKMKTFCVDFSPPGFGTMDKNQITSFALEHVNDKTELIRIMLRVSITEELTAYWIQFQFGEDGYVVSIPRSTDVWTKKYPSQLSEEEVKKIVKLEKESHFKELNEKLNLSRND